MNELAELRKRSPRLLVSSLEQYGSLLRSAGESPARTVRASLEHRADEAQLGFRRLIIYVPVALRTAATGQSRRFHN